MKLLTTPVINFLYETTLKKHSYSMLQHWMLKILDHVSIFTVSLQMCVFSFAS